MHSKYACRPCSMMKSTSFPASTSVTKMLASWLILIGVFTADCTSDTRCDLSKPSLIKISDQHKAIDYCSNQPIVQSCEISFYASKHRAVIGFQSSRPCVDPYLNEAQWIYHVEIVLTMGYTTTSGLYEIKVLV